MAKIINCKKCFQRPITAKQSQWFITSCGGGGRGEGFWGSGVLGFWGSGVITYHMDFKGSGGGGQSSPIKCIEGTIKNSQPIRSGGGGGHKNITEP